MFFFTKKKKVGLRGTREHLNELSEMLLEIETIMKCAPELNSVINLTCPNGTSNSGLVETEWSRLYTKLKREFDLLSGITSTGDLVPTRKSMTATGCRYICRTEEMMKKHIYECNYFT